MSDGNPTTSEKPDKPYPDFTHATRRCVKKIKGKMHYFGPRDDPDGALAKYLAEQQRNSGSDLIGDLAHVHGTGFGLTASREKAETETLEALRSAAATLQEKAPDELAAYQELVIGVAEHVASAKTGVKPSETEAITKIKEALGVAG